MTDASTTLAGRYVLGANIGRGGMADVYLGTDQVLGRPVAIKVLAEHYAGQPSFVDRFRQEARTAARLNHPNIVGVHDSGSDQGLHYIVMEHVDGPTLADIIADQGPLPPERAIAIVGRVCSALSVAHDAGVVHRDIKPSNIMLTSDGQVKVADFGIARAVEEESATQPGTVLGSAAYLSPEQALGNELDARSDIYSLGCVLFEALTGRPPFAGDIAVAIAVQHAEAPAPAPSQYADGITDALDRIVLRALAKDPLDRFQSAEELRRTLALVGAPAGATRAMSPVARDQTQLLQPVPAATRTEQAVVATKPRSSAAALWAVFVVLVLIVIGVAAVAALSPDFNLPGDWPGAGGRETPSTSTSPTPSTSASPSLSASPTVSASASPTRITQATTAIANLLGQGRDAGEIAGPAVNAIYTHVLAARDAGHEGRVASALEAVDRARAEVAARRDAGEITTDQRAAGLLAALDDLEAAIEPD